MEDPALPLRRSNETLSSGGLVEMRGFSHFIASDVNSFEVPFLDVDGSVLMAISFSRATAANTGVRLGLRRITPSGDYDSGFGLGTPGSNLPSSNQFISLDSPSSRMSGMESYGLVTPVGSGWMGGQLYVVANGEVGIPLDAHPAEVLKSNVLVVSRWNAQGRIDQTFGHMGVQEGGFDPDRVDFQPSGVLVLPAEDRGHRVGASPAEPELIVFGTAARVETESHQVGGGTPFTVKVKRRAEPAFFRISHPGGVDPTPPQFLQMQEFKAEVVAGRILPGAPPSGRPRLRLVCADRRSQPFNNSLLMSNFGAIGQFAVDHRLVLNPVL